jgi:uncharacterized protein
MRGLFVDTAGWVACADAVDLAYGRATAARDEWLEEGGMLVTSDYVVDETLTMLRFRLGLAETEAWWRQLEDSFCLQWEYISVERAEKARAMFFRYNDKEYSFTDCTSFVVMQELRLREALTTDHHFRQAGFLALPHA